MGSCTFALRTALSGASERPWTFSMVNCFDCVQSFSFEEKACGFFWLQTYFVVKYVCWSLIIHTKLCACLGISNELKSL